MVATPRDSFSSGVIPFTRLMVYVAKAAGIDPTRDDAEPFLYCREIVHGVGNQLPYAIIEVDQAAIGLRIQDEYLSTFMNRRVEIWTLRNSPDPENPDENRDTPLFWGEIFESNMELAPEGERRILRASVQPYLVGPTIAEGQQVWNHHMGRVETVDLDLEFNPEIDQKVHFNRARANQARNPRDYDIWVDPESVRSDHAKTEFHPTVSEWHLRDIVDTLCKWLNGSELYVKNPTNLLDLDEGDHPAIKSLVLKAGGYLPEYLSAILPAYDYNWFLHCRRGEDSGKVENEIVIYRRGESSAEKTFRMQRWGETFNPSESNTQSLSCSFQIADVVNWLEVVGDFKEYEVTWPLFPTWSEDQDSQIPDLHDANNHIGRKYAANEGGDYCGLRDEIGEDPHGYTAYPPKRREIEDCLTLRTDERGEGHRRPPFVEISDDGGETWRPLRKLTGDDDTTSNYHGYTILPDEVGIWISGTIPATLHDPKTFKLRITGTVKTDERLRADIELEDVNGSVNSHVIKKVIDASDRFFFRRRDSSSKLTGDYFFQDDSNAIELFGQRLFEQQQAAQIRAQARLWGLRTEYRLGDVISDVIGREISFNRLSREAMEVQYLQVVGIQWVNSEKEQYTMITAEPFDA